MRRRAPVPSRSSRFREKKNEARCKTRNDKRQVTSWLNLQSTEQQRLAQQQALEQARSEAQEASRNVTALQQVRLCHVSMFLSNQ